MMEPLHFLLDETRGWVEDPDSPADSEPTEDPIAKLAEALNPKLRIDLRAETEEQVVALDSFDWRLFQAGLELTAGDGRSRIQTTSRSPRKEAVDLTAETEQLPTFVNDLPSGKLREVITPVIGQRRLLPMASFRRRRLSMRFLDLRDKTVVRGYLESVSIEGQKKPLGRRLTLIPVRGYKRPFNDVRKAVVSALNPTVTEQSVSFLACTASGRPPGGYTTRLDLQLHGEMRADLGLRLVHGRLLDIIEENLYGARESLDTEFLHDLRVALRRSRTALSQVRGVYPQVTVDHFKGELRWLFRRIGPLRDLDVFLEALPEYRALVAPDSTRDLDPLQDFLEARRHAEQQTVRDLLSGRRTRQILGSWRHFLDSELPTSGGPPMARTPLGRVARIDIARLWKRVLHRGTRIDRATPDPALHELRVEIKKLRYLLEFFHSVLPPEVREFSKSLKRLQSTLGNFVDTVVQQRHVEQFATEMAMDGSASPQTLLAMGQLIPQFEARRIEERGHFEERFADLSTSENRDRMDKILADIQPR
ncbi:MAG: CHAD domain-containing protein [Thermoanaerobaculia bacterium]|nr:CHAD domain-containing protein [Thermoanaerobaculia bacterium]